MCFCVIAMGVPAITSMFQTFYKKKKRKKERKEKEKKRGGGKETPGFASEKEK